MGLNDAAEMLEVAKAENLRLEQELNGVTSNVLPWISAYYRTLDERDRARATAVRLEQELAALEAEHDALAVQVVPGWLLADRIERARRAGWRPAGGLVSE